MGLRIQVVRCGRCGKPRGVTHTCITSAASNRKPGRTRLVPRAVVTCGTCGKPRALAHTCTVRTDFKKRRIAATRQAAAEQKRARRAEAAARRKAAERERRRRAAERKRQAAADRAERRKTAAALRTGRPVPAAGRPRSSGQHDFRACTDAHCEKPYCLIWKEALREGQEAGYESGYEKGYETGLASCPLPHGGGGSRMITLALIALAALTGWLASVYLYPFRHCGRCGGTGRKKGSTRRRFDLCGRCSGTGRVQRFGSAFAHRTVLSVRSEIARERQRRREQRADARTRNPRRTRP